MLFLHLLQKHLFLEHRCTAPDYKCLTSGNCSDSQCQQHLLVWRIKLKASKMSAIWQIFVLTQKPPSCCLHLREKKQFCFYSEYSNLYHKRQVWFMNKYINRGVEFILHASVYRCDRAKKYLRASAQHIIFSLIFSLNSLSFAVSVWYSLTEAELKSVAIRGFLVLVGMR